MRKIKAYGHWYPDGSMAMISYAPDYVSWRCGKCGIGGAARGTGCASDMHADMEAHRKEHAHYRTVMVKDLFHEIYEVRWVETGKWWWEV